VTFVIKIHTLISPPSIPNRIGSLRHTATHVVPWQMNSTAMKSLKWSGWN